MTDQEEPIGRLAMRVEGSTWVAYYAQATTMEGAVLLGSIAMRFIAKDEQRKHAFMELMREAVADIIEEIYGERPQWGTPKQAPESERSGNA